MSTFLPIIISSLLLSFSPYLYPLLLRFINWVVKKYKEISLLLEEVLEPINGIRSLIFGLTGVISFTWLLLFSLSYHKMGAKWFTGTFVEVSVFKAAVIVSILVALSLVLTNWFRDREKVTEWATMLALGLILFLSTMMGVVFTENNQQRSGEEYLYSETISGHYLYYGMYQQQDYDIDVNVDDDNGNAPIIAGAIAIVFMSAIVPHFWFFVGIVIITMMIVVILREFLKQLGNLIGVLKNE